MPKSPMLGARVPTEWHEKIREIAKTSGKKESDIVRAAIALYLGEIDPADMKGAIASLQERLTKVEARLTVIERDS